MDRAPFVTIRCPACGSADARAQGGDRYTCTHCSSNFLYTGPRHAPTLVRAPQQRSNNAAAIVIVAVVVMAVAGVVVSFVFASAARSIGSAVAVEHQVAEAAPSVRTPVRPTPTPMRTPERPTPAAPAKPTPTVATPTTPTEPAPTPEPAGPRPFADYQHLKGCECGGSKSPMLHVTSTGSTTSITGAGVSVERAYEFAVGTTSDNYWMLPTTEETAPSTHYVENVVTVGIGCAGTTVVVAAGDRLSAWSSDTRALLWTTPLPAAFGDFGTQPGNDVILDCKRLTPKKDSVTVRAGNRNVRIALADGTIR